jgi:glycosyltransferase involved in cell wall biosynthesis
MNNQIISIFNKSIRPKKDKYNILTFDTHERYQNQLCKTGHNFYSFRYSGCKKWNKEYGEIPENYYVLPENTIPSAIDFDFILSQSKFGQFQASQKINQSLRIPIVSLEHTLPIPSWPEQQLAIFRKMIGDVNIFISEYSRNYWNMNCDGKVITHSADTELFHPGEWERKNHVLSVANDFINRDYCLNYEGWKRVTEGFPVRVVGDTPGLSEAAKNVSELVKEYQTSSVFFNSSTISPVPTSLVEAMCCGCAIVSTATCMIPEIIENGVNGFISNDEEELKGYIKQLLDDPALAAKMGNAARKTATEKFSEQKFINEWNELFDLAYRMKK